MVLARGFREHSGLKDFESWLTGRKGQNICTGIMSELVGVLYTSFSLNYKVNKP